MTYVSCVPPIIPDGEISPVRLEIMARSFDLRIQPSRALTGLSHGMHSPPNHSVCRFLFSFQGWNCCDRLIVQDDLMPTNTFPETIIQGSLALEALPSFFAPYKPMRGSCGPHLPFGSFSAL